MHTDQIAKFHATSSQKHIWDSRSVQRVNGWLVIDKPLIAINSHLQTLTKDLIKDDCDRLNVKRIIGVVLVTFSYYHYN